MHGQERVCEASKSGSEFIHLFAPVASSTSWSIRQLCADRAQVRPGLRHSEPLASLADNKGAMVLTAEATLGEVIPPELYGGPGVPERGTRLPRRVVSPKGVIPTRGRRSSVSRQCRGLFERDCAGAKRRQARRARKHDPAGGTLEEERTRDSHGCEITKKIGEWSVAKQLETMQGTYTGQHGRENGKEIEASELRESRVFGSPRELTGEDKSRALSVRPELSRARS